MRLPGQSIWRGAVHAVCVGALCAAGIGVVFRASLGLTTVPVVAQERVGPPSNLASLFNTGANIGFSVIRAAYSPRDQPPPQAAADWMLKDMANAKQWSSALGACIAFDATRFDAAVSQVRAGTPAGRLLPMFEQLYKDYQVAVRSSKCTFGVPTLQNLEAFFVGAVLTGSATARASYFYYPTPLPAEVVPQIRQDFAGMRLALPQATCMGSAMPVLTRIDQIDGWLASAAGQAVYTELVGIYQQIEGAAGAAACAGAAAPPTPPPAVNSCVPETLIRTTCANVCQGAGVLLGVVQGSPDCVACVNRCR